MKTRIFSTVLWAALFIAFVAGSAFAAPKFILVYYDGHMHTDRSDGTGSVADIKEIAQSRGLDAVIVTDHCKDLTKAEWDSLVADCEDASEPDFLALPGFEVTGSDGIFNRTHVNALGVDDPFVGDDECELCPEEVWESPENPLGTGAVYPENITKWVDYIHSKGGIAVHNHPSGTTSLDYGVNCMEVYNQSHVDDVIGYAAQLGYPPADALGFAITMNNFALYGERDVNMLVPFPGVPYPIPLRNALYLATQYFEPYIGQWLGAPQAPLSSWDELLLAYVDGTVESPIFGLANSDDHKAAYASSKIGVAKNGAYVKELSAQELYKAIKSGRTFATTGPSLNFAVNGELMGETAYVFEGDSANITLSVNSESMTKIVANIDIIKNGQVWQTINPMYPFYEATLEDDAVTEDGYYRIEVTSYDVNDGSYQFAWSNPVFVRITE
jgi:hypothetical protein